jgi:predicted DNA-binding transcriptional regulator AlpA
MIQTHEHDAKARFLRIDKVEGLTAISRSHIHHLASQGQFPKLVKRRHGSAGNLSPAQFEKKFLSGS